MRRGPTVCSLKRALYTLLGSREASQTLQDLIAGLHPAGGSDRAHLLVRASLTLAGVPCGISPFAHQFYAETLNMPGWRAMSVIDLRIQPGDLLFFGADSTPEHVALAVKQPDSMVGKSVLVMDWEPGSWTARLDLDGEKPLVRVLRFGSA